MSSQKSARTMTSFAAVVGTSASDGPPIASGWGSLPFERCIKRERGLFEVGKLNQDQYHSTGKYPIIDQGQGVIAGYSDDESQVYRGPLPVVLFGDHTRELKYIRFPFICGADGVKVLVPDESFVVPEFLYYFLKQARIPSRGYNRHYRLLRELRVPLPCKDEQRRIARVLATIQRAMEVQEKVIAAARELKRSLMKHLFTYGPVPIAETCRVSLKETELGPVPEHWNPGLFGTFITLQRGFDLPKQTRKIGSVPVVSSSGITGLHDQAKVRGPGVVTGRYGTLDQVHFVDIDFWPLNTTLFVKDFHGNDPRFVRYFLGTIDFGRFNDKTSVPGVNRNQVHILRVAIPPLEEQQQIVSCLLSVEKKIEVEEKRDAALQALFKTMLHHLMTGKIRVREDF